MLKILWGNHNQYNEYKNVLSKSNHHAVFLSRKRSKHIEISSRKQLLVLFGYRTDTDVVSFIVVEKVDIVVAAMPRDKFGTSN